MGAVEQGFKEGSAGALLRAGIGVERDLSCEGLLGEEARIGGGEAMKAAKHDSGGGDDDDGKGDLADNEEARDSEAMSCAEDVSGVGAQAALQIPVAGLESGNQAGENPRED